MDSSFRDNFELLQHYVIPRELDDEIIFNSIETYPSELGKSIGDTDITNIKFYNKSMDIVELLGFQCDEIGYTDTIPLDRPHFGINYRILRLCNVYGTKDQKASKKRNALQYLTTEVVNNRDINLYDAGQNIRDFMHVEDVCRAIHLVIEKNPLNDIINIGSGIPHKFIDLMTYVRKKSNSISNINFIDPPPFHTTVQVKNMYLDVAKLKNHKFKPKHTIWSGIDEIIGNCKEK